MSDWIMLSVLTVVILYFFIKMKFKIDVSGTLTLIVHLFVSLIRLIGDYFDYYTAVQRVLFVNGIGMI